MRKLLHLALALFPLLVPAAIIDVSPATGAGVQAAINGATNGDTVRLSPGNQTVTWTSGLSTTTKAVTLDLNGCTIITNCPGSVIDFRSVSGFLTRITNGTFTTGTSTALVRYINLDASNNPSAFMRLDHVTFNGAGGANSVQLVHGTGKGLIDHCTFNANAVTEIIHNMGYGSNNNLTGWQVVVNPGTDEAWYIEDCTFNKQYSGPSGAGQVHGGFYGNRTVFRYNTINGLIFDGHGGTSLGQRWCEVYENDWFTATGDNLSRAVQLRAGTGVVFNNRLTGPTGGNIVPWEQSNPNGSYPQPYQIGRGTNQALDPLRIWNNVQNGTTQWSVNPVGSVIQLNRDYYVSTSTDIQRPGYTPYTYPHPRQGTGPPPVTQVAAPVMSPASGAYSGTQTFSMTQPTSGAEYRYTTDGSTPTTSSPLYTASFPICTDQTIRAIGFKAGSPNSPEASATYDFDPWSATGTMTWTTFGIPQQTGPFTATFTVRTTSGVADAVVGFGPTPVTTFTALAANLLFNVNGRVQVRSGTGYQPATPTYVYQPNTDYTISMVINPAAQLVTSVSITPAGGSTTSLGTNFAFRSPDHDATTELDNFGMRAGAGTITVSGLALDPAPPVPGTFIVNKDHPNAADDSSHGSEGAPFRTILGAIGLIQAGDTILVKQTATPYAEGFINITTKSGSAGNPTELKAYPGESPAIVGNGANNFYAVSLQGVRYWNIEGINISNADVAVLVRDGCDNITVKNCNLHDTGQEIVRIVNDCNNILFENNTLNRGGVLKTGSNGEGFYIGTHGDPSDDTYNITIRGNTITNVEHEAVELKHGTHDCLIENNIIHDVVADFQFGKWAITVFPGAATNPNQIIRNNIIYNVGDAGLSQGGTGGAFNLGAGCQVYNNVVYGTDMDNDGIHIWGVEFNGGDSHTRYVWNNTMNIPSAQATHSFGGTSNIGNNVGPPTSGSNRSFSAAYFVNSAANDYHLAPGSALINAGSTPPIAIAKDIAGVDRIAPIDIGAYESVGGGPADTTAPTPNPSTFASAPAASGQNSVRMTATTASDATSPPVEYYFDETSGHPGGTDSGWQLDPNYEDTGLTPETQYTYRVKTRDNRLNETGFSAEASANTDPSFAGATMSITTTFVSQLTTR